MGQIAFTASHWCGGDVEKVLWAMSGNQGTCIDEEEPFGSRRKADQRSSNADWPRRRYTEPNRASTRNHAGSIRTRIISPRQSHRMTAAGNPLPSKQTHSAWVAPH